MSENVLPVLREWVGRRRRLGGRRGWYQTAAGHGCTEATYNLGWLWRAGRCRRYGYRASEAERAAAAEWFRLAAEEGHPGAQDALSHHYRRGWGVEKDEAAVLLGAPRCGGRVRRGPVGACDALQRRKRRRGRPR